MKRVVMGHDAGYCPDCGYRLGDGWGPSVDGLYSITVDRHWFTRRHQWHRSRRRLKGRSHWQPVQSYETIVCACGVELLPPS